MGAISMEDKIAVINRDRCIGCGVCVAACVNDAHQMHKKDKTHIPPKTHDDMYKKIMIERFGLVSALKSVTRVLTGSNANGSVISGSALFIRGFDNNQMK
jgi:Fe-S-cluster-containing hydrogenase component 2